MLSESVREWSDKIRGELDKVGVVGCIGERNRLVVEKGGMVPTLPAFSA